MPILYGYNNSGGNAAKIYGNVTVYDTNNQDVTAYLKSIGVIDDGSLLHGFIVDSSNALAISVVNSSNALAINIIETLLAMSEAKNAGETPIFFAKIVDSATNTPLTQSDVSTVTYTIYKYTQSSIRTSGSSYTPIENWTNLSISVSDCFLNSLVENDPRTNFGYNFKFEPNTLTSNPFETSGQYMIKFIITPDSGNRIPLIYNLALS